MELYTSDCPSVSTIVLTSIQCSSSCSCGAAAPGDTSLRLHAGEWVEISLDVLYLLTGIDIVYDGATNQTTTEIQLQHREGLNEWRIINFTTSAEMYGGAFPLVSNFNLWLSRH